MRVLFFVQFFYPSREIGAKRPSEMAKHFIAEGHHVDVLCASPEAPWNQLQQAAFASSKITHVPVPPDIVLAIWNALKRGKRLLTGNARETTAASAPAASTKPSSQPAPQSVPTLRRWFFSFESLYCGLKLWTLKCIPRAIRQLREQKYDVVVNSCPPMNTALTIWFARRFAPKFHWVIDLRDPFVTPSAAASNSRFRMVLERWAERACLTACDTIIVASPGLANDILGRHPNLAAKIHVIYNGYDTEIGRAGATTSPPPASDTLKLLSAGTIYFARDPRPLLDAINLCMSRHALPRHAFHLTLLGNCENPSRETLQQWIEQRQLDGIVELVGAVPPHEVATFIERSHVLINFAQGQHMLIPAKTYEYMASGRETITITEPDSETAQVVKRTGCGPIAVPDPDVLADVLFDLYTRYITERAQFSPDHAAIKEFSRKAQSSRFLNLLKDAKPTLIDA